MRATLATLSLVVATVVLSAQQNPFVGRWNLRGTGPDTNKIYFLEVTQKDGQLQAIFLDRSAHATPVAWIRVEGNELVWQKGAGEGLLTEDGTLDPIRECGPIYRARLEGGKLVGSHNMPPPPCAPNPNAVAGRGAGRSDAGVASATRSARSRPRTALRRHPRSSGSARVSRSGRTRTRTASTPTASPSWSSDRASARKPGPAITPETWQTECVNRWTYDNGTMTNAVPAQGERADLQHLHEGEVQGLQGRSGTASGPGSEQRVLHPRALRAAVVRRAGRHGRWHHRGPPEPGRDLWLEGARLLRRQGARPVAEARSHRRRQPHHACGSTTSASTTTRSCRRSPAARSTTTSSRPDRS